MGLINADDLEERPALAWPYVAILLLEACALGSLAAVSRARPPMTYEMGWLGCGSMLVMQVYSVRRRVRALRNLGSLRGWLDAHVFFGFQGFVLVAYHSIGVSPSASLAAVNFALVATVVITGVLGRYLYGRIHRARVRATGRSGRRAARSSALEVAERWLARWTLLHRPLAILLLGITTLHVLAHFAYAV
jgi:hypothetical protein